MYLSMVVQSRGMTSARKSYFVCVFLTKAAADSDGSRTVIPIDPRTAPRRAFRAEVGDS